MLSKILGILGFLIIGALYYGVQHYRELPVNYNNQWVELTEKGDHMASIEFYEKALKMRPNDATFNWNISNALYKVENLTGALNHAEAALNLHSKWIGIELSDIHWHKWSVLYEMRNASWAIDSLSQAIESYSWGETKDLAQLYSERWEIYHEVIQDASAQADIEKSLSIDPDNLFSLYYDSLYKSYDETYNYTWALVSINKYIELAPDNGNGYLQKGEIYYYNGEYEEALEQYDLTLDIDPSYNQAHFHKGHILSWHDEEKALKSYKNAYDLYPDQFMYSFYVWRTLFELWKFSEAEKFLNKSFESEEAKDDAAICLYRVSIFLKLEKEEQFETLSKECFNWKILEEERLWELRDIFKTEGHSVLLTEIWSDKW